MHVFITGTGSGIGKTLAEHFLSRGISVTGISRNKVVQHDNFSFYEVDLANETSRDKFAFPDVQEDHVILINNAGTLGTIDLFEQLSPQDIRHTFRLNVEALMELTLKFINTFQQKKCTLIHIGSGAASRSIKGWSNYCASKAAVHHFNEVLNDEISHLGKEDLIRSIVVSPGVVDTPMQKKIRDTSPKKFPDVHTFIELKETGNLVSTDEVSEKIEHIITSGYKKSRVVELRNYTV